MIIYLLTLAVVFVLAYYAQTKQKVLEDGVIKKTSKSGKWAIAAVCAILIFIGGFRYGVGSDWWTYKDLFRHFVNRSIFDVWQEDEGAYWGIVTIVSWFTDDMIWVYVISQAIIVICIVPTLTKYTHNLSLSVFLYLATFDYFSSFNGVRQWVAAAMVFAAFPLLKERKVIRYCLMCLFAYFFHNTAILMIPVGLFVLTSPLNKWNILVLTAVGVLFFLLPDQFEALLGSIVDDKYTQFVGKEGDDGVNIIRVAVAALPMLFARMFYKQLHEGEEDKKFLNMLINFSTVNFIFCLVGTRGTFLYRMTMYTSPFNCLLIPYLLRAFKKESQFMAKVLIMAAFGLYLIILLPTEAQVLPYNNIFGWYFA